MFHHFDRGLRSRQIPLPNVNGRKSQQRKWVVRLESRRFVELSKREVRPPFTQLELREIDPHSCRLTARRNGLDEKPALIHPIALALPGADAERGDPTDEHENQKDPAGTNPSN